MPASCVFHDIVVSSLSPNSQTTGEVRVSAPVKAHLVDGSTIVFEDGIWVREGTIWGIGEKFDLTLTSLGPVSSLPVDTVAAMESFEARVDQTSTIIGSGAATFLGVSAAVLLAKALFGSCPTTYSAIDGTPVLEAESFSYSVVPYLEARDVDRLGIGDVQDHVILEVRNEALETHYINQLHLLEVRHEEHQAVLPTHDGQLVAVDSQVRPIRATDTSGQDITGVLHDADGEAWQESDARLAELSPDDLYDHIDLEFDGLPAGTNQALTLRFRNSLLNTVLFYNIMLKGLGFEALDWMSRATPTLKMMQAGRRYQKQMGMRVSVLEGSRYREVAHIPDQGPIAWKEVAVPLSTTAKQVKVRLSFVSDNWRLDSATAGTMQYAKGRSIALTSVTVGDVRRDDSLKSLAASDSNYLITKPGDRLQVRFDVDQTPSARTFFLDAEGYYVEWMRNEWLTAGTNDPVKPGSREGLWRAMQNWRKSRDSFRQQFDNSKIAVR